MTTDFRNLPKFFMGTELGDHLALSRWVLLLGKHVLVRMTAHLTNELPSHLYRKKKKICLFGYRNIFKTFLHPPLYFWDAVITLFLILFFCSCCNHLSVCSCWGKSKTLPSVSDFTIHVKGPRKKRLSTHSFHQYISALLLLSKEWFQNPGNSYWRESHYSYALG